jgi:inner membrane protein YidH
VFQPRSPTTTDLAIVGTQLAHERTLIAWIRTAFSMISFGFTIFKAFQYLAESKALGVHRQGAVRAISAPP